RAFSITSLITLAGRSTTSPAAMRLIRSGGRRRMVMAPIIAPIPAKPRRASPPGRMAGQGALAQMTDGADAVIDPVEPPDPVLAVAVQDVIAEPAHGEDVSGEPVDPRPARRRRRRVVQIKTVAAGADHQLRRPGRAKA